MTNVNYGEVFKNIRLQKGISLNQLQKIWGVSKSTLSQFENGNSLLSYDKLLRALEALHVTMYEYTLFTREGIPEAFLSDFYQILNAFYAQDKAKLESIYLENCYSEDTSMYILSLCAKATYSKLHPSEIEKIKKRLEFLPLWGSYELYVLLCTVEQLPLSLIDNLVQEFISSQSTINYLNILRGFHSLVVHILIKIIYVYILNDEKEKARNLLKSIKIFLPDTDITSKIILYILEGCYSYKFGHKSKEEKINRGLEMLEEIGEDKLKTLLGIKIQEIKES